MNYIEKYKSVKAHLNSCGLIQKEMNCIGDAECSDSHRQNNTFVHEVQRPVASSTTSSQETELISSPYSRHQTRESRFPAEHVHALLRNGDDILPHWVSSSRDALQIVVLRWQPTPNSEPAGIRPARHIPPAVDFEVWRENGSRCSMSNAWCRKKIQNWLYSELYSSVASQPLSRLFVDRSAKAWPQNHLRLYCMIHSQSRYGHVFW